MAKIVLATSNRGKIAELRADLAPRGFELISQVDYGIDPVAETALTFVENALLKGSHASRMSGMPALADDSGLVVPALGGRPGLHSARYAGEQASDLQNCQKLLQEMQNLTGDQRRAYFYTVIIYLRHPDDPAPLICQGSWHGVIAEIAHGEMGFGYDPIFYLPELGHSAAEITREEKNLYSHRGQAVRQLLAQLSHG